MTTTTIIRRRCDKCNQYVPAEHTRKFNLTLRSDNLRRNTKIDQIVLCLSCNALRRTTITKYVEL